MTVRHKTILLTANMIITGRAEFPCIASFGKHSSSYQNNSENGNHSSCHSLAKAFTASFRRTSALGWIFDSGCPHRFRHSEFRLSCLLTVVKFQSFGSLHNHSLSSSTPAAQGHQGGCLENLHSIRIYPLRHPCFGRSSTLQGASLRLGYRVFQGSCSKSNAILDSPCESSILGARLWSRVCEQVVVRTFTGAWSYLILEKASDSLCLQFGMTIENDGSYQ